ncbi:50S ribosomal protein L22 [Ilumatobacter coccineus]|uniref:Large ribosomal subunit protein uL22 n=1 Tax=Ilumatobacter coccineus (strain NBRC 103263 / KCTC 29153 / YM16-304) TaxID=1313172 RepID=A0A6C7DXM9_ILUCY|nr:50S ribosomal protein L22 [Ilumatobacter coccineus YM16-304]
MTGPKLNEKSFVAGERSGTKSTAKYVRSSASKARAVLDLIRGLDVTSADEVLRFTDRHIAHDVRKVLASAVANAINNDGQDASELFVIACFADEGPTLRRFRPRARGRASRINKRTCHITVIVARMSDDRISIVQARQERQGGAGASGRPQSSAASRKARVDRSKAKDAADEAVTDEAATDDAAAEYAAGDADNDGEANAVDASPHGEGSHAPLDDVDEMPEGYEIKGNAQSMLYHEPGSRYYKATKAEVWFDSVESAEAAGFSKPGANKEEAADTESTANDEDVAADEAEEN